MTTMTKKIDTTNLVKLPRPTHKQYKDILERFGIKMSEVMIDKYLNLSEGSFKAYDYVVQAQNSLLLKPINTERFFYYPKEEENSKNAWYVKTDIKPTAEGKLSGKTVVLKDNISLAKVPMMNGSDMLKGYVPEIDATVVTRVLESGGRIVGKGHSEYMCLSGGSHTGYQGGVHNPLKDGYSSGGSSSGVAVLVALGEADMGIGGDQGGSIRIPSSFSGLYGMKPTYGLVPYTGIVGVERTIDHAGPITRTVLDNAILLEVIAGYDNGLDPRQYDPKTDEYTKNLGKPITEMKIGILKEGFELPNIEESVKSKVLKSAEVFKLLGATVEEVSIPIHAHGSAIWTPITLDGLQDFMMNSHATGTNAKGFYDIALNSHMHNWQDNNFHLSPSLLISMLIGQWSLDISGGVLYGKAQNLAIELRAAYDEKFNEYDVLLMPTLPITAKPIPNESDLELYIQRAFEMIGNTAPFDATGHPALSIPCGFDDDGLPIGMMLVGKHYSESTIYQIAHQFEENDFLHNIEEVAGHIKSDL